MKRKSVLVLMLTFFVLIGMCPEAFAGLYVYPKSGQSPDKQQADQQECYAWAKQQTGYNPNANVPVYQSQGAQQGSGVKGAAGGAVKGLVISSVADGDKGKGAAAGAIGGVVAGRIRSRRQQEQIAQAKNETVQDMRSQGEGDYLRACKACLEARGYSVS